MYLKSAVNLVGMGNKVLAVKLSWCAHPPFYFPVSSSSFQVPEMLHNDAGDHGFSHWGFFLLQNAGILLGFCIMLLIAIFEHKIQLDLGY